jgi:hypothetical protein
MRPIGRAQVAHPQDQMHTVFGQSRNHVVHETILMQPELLTYRRADRPELIFRGHAVGSPLYDSCSELLLETGHPDLEELIQIAAEDAEKLEALEKRSALVQRFVEHPTIELEPGQLSVQIERRMPEIENRRLGCELGRRRYLRHAYQCTQRGPLEGIACNGFVTDGGTMAYTDVSPSGRSQPCAARPTKSVSNVLTTPITRPPSRAATKPST